MWGTPYFGKLGGLNSCLTLLTIKRRWRLCSRPVEYIPRTRPSRLKVQYPTLLGYFQVFLIFLQLQNKCQVVNKNRNALPTPDHRGLQPKLFPQVLQKPSAKAIPILMLYPDCCMIFFVYVIPLLHVVCWKKESRWKTSPVYVKFGTLYKHNTKYVMKQAKINITQFQTTVYMHIKLLFTLRCTVHTFMVLWYMTSYSRIWVSQILFFIICNL